jgi:MoxR-like ATPase
MKANDLYLELRKHMFGSEMVIEDYVAALVSHGNVLLLGAPGRAKTTMAEITAKLLGGTYVRIQGAPDLRKTDWMARLNNAELLKGSETVEWKDIERADLVVIDEINRINPAEQSNFLAVIQEGLLQYCGKNTSTQDPVYIGTMNPRDEGNYPLNPALKDRFHVTLETTSLNVLQKLELEEYLDKKPKVEAVFKPDALRRVQEKTAKIPLCDDARLLANHIIRDFQICHPCLKDNFEGRPVDKEYLQPGACASCRMNQHICSKVRNSLGDRTLQHLIQQARGYASLSEDKKVQTAHINRSLLATLTYRLEIQPQYLAEHPTKQHATQALIKELMEVQSKRAPTLNLIGRLTTNYDPKIVRQIEAQAQNDPLLYELLSETVRSYRESKNRVLKMIRQARDPQVLSELLEQIDGGKIQVVDKEEVCQKLVEKLSTLLHIREDLDDAGFTRMKVKAASHCPEFAEIVKNDPAIKKHSGGKMSFEFDGKTFKAVFTCQDTYEQMNALLKASMVSQMTLRC